MTNELSYLSLEALRRTRLVYPTVGVCWHLETPAALTGLAVELIAQGYPTPAFFGDETIQRGFPEPETVAAWVAKVAAATRVPVVMG